MAAKDITGLRFGRLVAIEPFDRRSGGIGWRCMCDCGKEHVVVVNALMTGNTKSCGCAMRGPEFRARISQARTTHGMERSREYSSWRSMHSRCRNPNDPSWRYYGGRGISVCSRWVAFENFYDDMGARPPGKSIDRIDNDKDYGPDNCRWATQAEQNANRRVTRNQTDKELT